MKTHTRPKTCSDYRRALSTFKITGFADDDYINHLGTCDHCQQDMQSSALRNVKALKKPKRI